MKFIEIEDTTINIDNVVYIKKSESRMFSTSTNQNVISYLLSLTMMNNDILTFNFENKSTRDYVLNNIVFK